MKLSLFKLVIFLSLSAISFLKADHDRTRPNIILIMVDDMGYSDIGCYGGEVKTPNLDKIAENGLRFKQFYNTAKCHTTRAELLTGNYAYSVGDHNMEHGATFGEVLREVGYRTLISGKWHQRPLPTTRGFDRYYGLADGCCNFFNPGVEARGGGAWVEKVRTDLDVGPLKIRSSWDTPIRIRNFIRLMPLLTMRLSG